MDKKRYLYLDRYLFEVRPTLNGWSIYATNLGTGYAAPATPEVCAKMELAWPRNWQPHFAHAFKCQALKALGELATMNGMTELETKTIEK